MDRTKKIIRFTQLVKIQRFIDAFGCNGKETGDKAPTTLAMPGTVLEYNKELDEPLQSRKQTEY